MDAVTLKFDVYYKDKKTGHIDIQNGKLVTKQLLTTDMFENPFVNMESVDVILYYIKSRAIPYERDNIDEILSALGLDEYNAYDIVKAMHGVDIDDFVWFKFAGDENLKFKDVHARA